MWKSSFLKLWNSKQHIPFFTNEKIGVFTRELIKLTDFNKFFIRKLRFSQILSFFTNENELLRKVFKVIFDKWTVELILLSTNEKAGFSTNRFVKSTSFDRFSTHEEHFSSFSKNRNRQHKKVFKVIFDKWTTSMILRLTNRK